MKKDHVSSYIHITDFRSLKKGDVAFLADQPDARLCTSSEEVEITMNRPSQWHSRYPNGYIGIEDGRYFDLARQTVDGRRVYLFPRHPAVVEVFRRLEAENRLWHLLAGQQEQLVLIAQLVTEAAGRPAFSIPAFFPSPWREQSAERAIRDHLSALSIREVQALVDLVEPDWQECKAVLAA